MTIAALIITYKPKLNILKSVIETLENQVNIICIINNGEELNNSLFNTNCKIIIQNLGTNYGIARATNIGFSVLNNEDIDYVLLSDQDTEYPCNYINNFKEYINTNNTELICCFSPVFFDLNSNEYKPIYKVINKKIKKIQPSKKPEEVFQAIASGLIVDNKKFKLIGGMNEDLFIDYVDFEWCWKVNYYGYKIMCLPQLQIIHRLGDSVVSVGAKKIAEHNYIRNYYITRNTTYLSLNTEYLTFSMKFHLFLKAIMYILGFSLFFKPHIKNLVYTFKGFRDGIHKVLGIIKD